MGIGNPGEEPEGDEHEHLLITPHGDWEPLPLKPGGTPDRVSSLPLMGIGNPGGRPRAEIPAEVAHYPSWGLGTQPTPPPGKPANGATHYPSWGLGTLADERHLTLHPGLSLPLMGIGNPLRRIVDLRDGLQLITPHGDWEPAAVRQAGRRLVLLITPHGDWEPFPPVKV